jgi:hypothetical protein
VCCAVYVVNRDAQRRGESRCRDTRDVRGLRLRSQALHANHSVIENVSHASVASAYREMWNGSLFQSDVTHTAVLAQAVRWRGRWFLRCSLGVAQRQFDLV